MTDKADKILQKVRALLAKAEDKAVGPEEAQVFRDKADELMVAYSIEAWQLTTDQEGNEPQRRDIDTAWYWDPNMRHIRDEIWWLFINVSKHCRCKVVNWVGYSTNPVLGMPADLDYLDLLFTHLYQQMLLQMNPDPQDGDTMIEALVRMKEAGMKWESIHAKLVRADLAGEEWRRSFGVKYTKMYTDYCEETGRSRKYINPKTYQRSFAEGFRASVSARLNQQKEKARKKEGSGMDLAVRDIRKALNNMAEDMFGPNTVHGRVSTHSARDEAGHQAGHVAGKEASIVAHQNRRVSGRKEIEA